MSSTFSDNAEIPASILGGDDPNSLQRLSNTATVEEAGAVLREHGHVIIENLASDEAMDQLLEETMPYIDASKYGEDYFTGTKTRRTGRLMARSPKARELVMNPLVLGVARNFLSHSDGIQLASTEMICIEPGQQAQMLHIDDMAAGYPFPYDFPLYCNTMWAVTDIVEENGGTRVVPGSHKKQFEAQNYTPADTVPVEMPKGSVFMFSGKIVHGGGANTSKTDIRRAAFFPYTVSWMRQEENQYVACPQDIARTLPEDLLRVMGYAELGGLGHAGNMMDPLAALHGA
ncbi:phytanoyl-CoA dioxygenase family protein [Nocardia rhamnosiphila]|uniref:phytanoyl-CoA dioxygenase family protein n=1 Tax=Nocardia rhamnosiphila TaxID=426716 RepID=UPI0033C2558F